MEKDKYAYFYERQALNDRLAHINFEMNRRWKEFLHYKTMQDNVLKRIAELDKGEDYGDTEQNWLGNTDRPSTTTGEELPETNG